MKKKRSFVFALLLALACLFATAALASEVATTNTNVNLRSGPGTQYERLAIIPTGTNVNVEEKDTGNGWTKISYNDKSGYVVTRYLGTGTANASSGSYTTTARVHLRSGPGTNNAVILTVPKGAAVTVSGSSNGWASASYNGKSGYIATQYLQAAGGSAANPNTTVTGNTGAAGSASATTTSNVNLRSGAGTSYSVVVVVPKGASVTVISTANGWANVSYNGKTGYMSAQYLSGLAGGGGTSGTQTTTARVNMRSGPATSNSVVLIIPKGASVTVTSTSNGWSAVSYNGKNGYVSSQYLSGSAGSGSATTVTGNTGAAGSASATATANVNMRSGAGTSYSVVTVVPKGAAVTVNSTANGWASVSYGGKNGYISTKYLSGLAGSGGSTSSTKKTTANVRLRSGAGTSSSIILTIPKGSSVTVTSTSNGWSAVSYNGYNGYVSSQYLS